jgi:hypothetical protein
MKKPYMMTAVAAVFLAALITLPSCFEDTTEPVKEKTAVDWPDMTSRDDVVKTIVLAYTHPNDVQTASKYNALLHSQYFFKFQERDVGPGESPVMTRAEDILSTEWIFENETMLELLLTPEIGSWDACPEIDGAPCEDCWETTRSYFIRAQFGEETVIHQSPPGRVFVTIIAAPEGSDPMKWTIRAIYDIAM